MIIHLSLLYDSDTLFIGHLDVCSCNAKTVRLWNVWVAFGSKQAMEAVAIE